MTKSFWRVVVGLAAMATIGAAEARQADVFDHAAGMKKPHRDSA